MVDVFDTSSIPDEPAYWDALASRIANAAPRSRSGVAWVGSRRSGWMAAAYLAAAAAMVLAAVMATAHPRGPATAAVLASVLAPNDPLGRMVAGAAPPSLAALSVDAPRSREAP